MIKNLMLCIVLCTPLMAFSQKVTGLVYEFNEDNTTNKKTLIGASIYWLNTSIGTTTDTSGKFEIPISNKNNQLVVSFIGYTTDTVLVDSKKSSLLTIDLKPEISLNEVDIEVKKRASEISTQALFNEEKLTSKEFEKAACCNLSESFETNATVDVNFTDAVSGAKQIQMLGLDGVYSQILFENLPFLRGLSSARGLSYVPGTWLQSISITKGNGSVVNGFESMTGKINLELIQPDKAPLLYFNVYGNQMGRAETNLQLTSELGKRWSSALLMHVSDVSQANDRNDDGFLDVPKKRQYNLLNRWKYKGNRYTAQFGVRALSDENTGGEKMFDRNNTDQGLYGVGIESTEMEFFFKNGLIFPSAPKRSIALIGSAKHSDHNYFFGNKNYEGTQQTVYLNLVYQSSFISQNHVFKLGSNYMLDDYDETYIDSNFTRTEQIPSLYGEYTYTSDNEKISLNLGVRNDFHNLYGSIVSPRVHFKYSPHPLTSFRISGGRGFRTANVFAENVNIFASSRAVLVLEQLEPEISWNAGVSVTHKFKLFGKRSYINLDYFRTEFENQVIVDLENPDAIKFYNLDGISYSNSVQLDLGVTLNNSWDMKIAGKVYEVKSTFDGDLKDQPLVKNAGGLFNIGYESKNRKWRWDMTTVAHGGSRIPSTAENPEQYQLSTRSDIYQTFNTQITRKMKGLEVYVGCENLTNYRQPNAIIAADDPFGPYFDASLIWGPIAGRTIYGGLKYLIFKK